jgi:hypothetical protein
MTLSDRT